MQSIVALLAYLSAGIVVGALWLTSSLPVPFLLCCGVTLVVALSYPSVAVGAVLMSLPLFGNRAGTLQALGLSALTCHLLLGLALRCTRLERTRGALHTLGCAYAVVSVLSLLGMPLHRWLSGWIGKVPLVTDLQGWGYLVVSVLQSSESSIQYPLLSVFFTLWAIQLGFCICSLVTTRPDWALHYGRLILVGLVLTCGVGILDYYGVWSIEAFRALDPVVNPDGRQYRMQSFFGHSGWFAEYVTLAIPFVLVLLVGKRSFAMRVCTVVAVLLLGEFVLILSFQRGGWLSYPLTLLVVWSAIYITRKIEKGERQVLQALRSSVLKILISLPITVVLSLVLLATFQPSRMRGVGEPVAVRYFERFKEIGNTTDRSEFFMAGWLLGTLSPFIGNGSESFAYHFRREFNDPDGAFYGRYHLPLHGSAHNVYMQTFSGKGAAGLLLLLAIVCTLVWKGFALALADPQSTSERRVLRLAIACFGGAFLIYGNVQEIFYIQSLQVLCFAVWGLGLALLPVRQGGERFLWGGVVLALLAHLLWVGPRGEGPLHYGCYAPAPRARWCGTLAHQPFLVRTGPEGSYVLLRLFTPHWDQISGESAELSVSYRGQELKRVSLRPATVVQLQIKIPGVPGEEVALDLKSNGYVIRGRGKPRRASYPLVSYRLLPASS